MAAPANPVVDALVAVHVSMLLFYSFCVVMNIYIYIDTMICRDLPYVIYPPKSSQHMAGAQQSEMKRWLWYSQVPWFLVIKD